MKIRTDFVTNSSSSNFVVEIEVELTDKSRFVFESKKDNRYGGVEANLSCSSSSILRAGSVEKLCSVLNSKFKCGYTPDETKMKKFTSELEENISDIKEISHIILRRIWTAEGEPASCHIINDDDLLTLCEKVADKSNDDKQQHIDELMQYLETAEVYAEGWDSWPSGFCSSKAIPRYKVGKKIKSLDDLATKLTKEPCYDDFAVETIIIDLQGKKVEAFADFYIYGDAADVEKKKPYRSEVLYTNICRNAIVNNFSDYRIAENVEISALKKDCGDLEGNIDFVLYDGDDIAKVAISIETAKNDGTEDLKNIAELCKSISLPYVRLNDKKISGAKKIAAYIKKALSNSEEKSIKSQSSPAKRENISDSVEFAYSQIDDIGESFYEDILDGESLCISKDETIKLPLNGKTLAVKIQIANKMNEINARFEDFLSNGVVLDTFYNPIDAVDGNLTENGVEEYWMLYKVNDGTEELDNEQIAHRVKLFAKVAELMHVEDVLSKVVEFLPKKKNGTLHKNRVTQIATLFCMEEDATMYVLCAVAKDDLNLIIEIRKIITSDLEKTQTDIITMSNLFR